MFVCSGLHNTMHLPGGPPPFSSMEEMGVGSSRAKRYSSQRQRAVPEPAPPMHLGVIEGHFYEPSKIRTSTTRLNPVKNVSAQVQRLCGHKLGCVTERDTEGGSEVWFSVQKHLETKDTAHDWPTGPGFAQGPLSPDGNQPQE